MWDLTVSVPDHCLSFYFAWFTMANVNKFYFCLFVLRFYGPVNS